MLLVGLRQLPHPLPLQNGVSDFSQCPIIHITDIFIYLREKCVGGHLGGWEEDDGANLSRAYHVHDVMVYIRQQR